MEQLPIGTETSGVARLQLLGAIGGGPLARELQVDPAATSPCAFNSWVDRPGGQYLAETAQVAPGEQQFVGTGTLVASVALRAA